MFQSLILPMKIGVSYGSGALKALQNDNIPELGLLVREAIQIVQMLLSISRRTPATSISHKEVSHPKRLMRCFQILDIF